MPDTPSTSPPAPARSGTPAHEQTPSLEDRARAIFESLAPLAAGDRAPIIDEVSRRDPEACAEALDLLRFHDRDAGVIDSGALDAARALDPALAPEPQAPVPHYNQSLRPGARLLGYLLLRPVGVGPAGVVYQAVAADARAPADADVVALKILRPDLPVPQMLEESGPDGTGAMHAPDLPCHPGIAAVRSVMVAEVDGRRRLVIASEHRPGRGIVDHTRTLALPPVERLRLFADAFDALSTLHAGAFVHGRIRGGNVVIDPRGCVLHDAALASLLGIQPPPADALDVLQTADTRCLLGLLVESLLGRSGGSALEPIDAATLEALGGVDRRLAAVGSVRDAGAMAELLRGIAAAPDAGPGLFGRVRRMIRRG